MDTESNLLPSWIILVITVHLNTQIHTHKAMKFFLKNFFYDHPAYRGEILNALSLLDSSLPELQFLSIDILTNLLRIATVSSGEGGANAKSVAGEPEKQDASLHVNLRKKVCN